MKTSKDILLLTGGLLAASLLAPAAAQTVYKSTRPDGSVVYSDKPLKDAVQVEEVDQSRVTVGKPATPPPAPGPADTRLRDKKTALDVAQARVVAAQQALDAAKQRQQQAAEPLPGERTGIVSGNGSVNTRLNGSYYARQRQLQADVDAAQRTLDQAYEQRNAARY
jgi:hypothetical protein